MDMLLTASSSYSVSYAVIRPTVGLTVLFVSPFFWQIHFNKWKLCVLLRHFIHDEPSVMGLLNKDGFRRWR